MSIAGSEVLQGLIVAAGSKVIEVVIDQSLKLFAVFKKEDKKNHITVVLYGEEEDLLPSQSDDVPILIQISQPAYLPTRQYLRKVKGIKTAITMITNQLTTNEEKTAFEWARIDPNNPAEWSGLAKEFIAQVREIQAKYGNKTYHLFISAPAALAFAMGTLAKDLFGFHIYQYDRALPDSYIEVIYSPDDLR